MGDIYFPIEIKLKNNIEIIIDYGESFNDYNYKVFECGLYLFSFNMDDVIKDKHELEKIIKESKKDLGLGR